MQTMHYVIHVWAWHMAAHTRTGTNTHMVKQGYPVIPVWAAHTRTGSPYAYGSRNIAYTCIGCPYAYGIAHMRMGKIRVWDGTSRFPAAYIM